MLMESDKTHREKARWELQKMLQTILNKYWTQHPTKQQLYSYLPSISKTIQDEKDIWDTTGGLRTNSWMTFFHETLHMGLLALANQQ